MQTALAVNTALMALVRRRSSAPSRTASPGGQAHAHLLRQDGHAHHRRTHRQGRGQRRLRRQWRRAVALGALGSASQELSCVVGGCHALLQVAGSLLGDPIELAASKGSAGRTTRRRAMAPTRRPDGGDREGGRRRRRRRRWRRSGAARPPPSWRRCTQRRWRRASRRDERGGAAEGGGRPPRSRCVRSSATTLRRRCSACRRSLTSRGCAVPTAAPRRECSAW